MRADSRELEKLIVIMVHLRRRVQALSRVH